ncbi:Helicase associated domain protein [Sphaerisporangium sp. NPDC049003]|uniref:DEAD/DEAH box helicase n=1 Tax=Sphaerisporangium sp. NPDC049003 TaxID=3364517 RepID=UPI0037138C01
MAPRTGHPEPASSPRRTGIEPAAPDSPAADEHPHHPTDPWFHQLVAVDAIEQALGRGGRAVVASPCGSGKSRIGAKAAGRLAPLGRVLVMVPTLELVGQMVRTFDKHGGVGLGRVVAVCSDARVLASNAALDVEGAQVTTDPAELASATAGPGRMTVLATYQSLPVLAAAHAGHGLKPWDLAIADEAHRTAGRAGRAWAVFHDDSAVPAKRRLYMTATPKILVGGEGTDELVSMDDEQIYGPTVFELPTSTAITRGLLADYELVVPIVTDTHVHQLAEEHDRHLQLARTAVDARMLAAQIAALRAAKEFDIRRMITFHNRVDQAKAWSATLPQAWQLMDPDHRPAAVSARHIHGGQDLAVRRAVLDYLGENPGQAGGEELRVVSNARVLTEGVDAPGVDAILLAAPRNSVIDTVQAVGRALRLGGRPGKVARIIVPVFLGPGENPEAALDGSAYAQVWQVLRALRAHDNRLADYLDMTRARIGAHDTLAHQDHSDLQRSGLRAGWLSLSGAPVPEGFASAIQVRAVEAASSSWMAYYGAAKAHFDTHGSIDLPVSHVTATGLRLGQWLRNQRKLRDSMPKERVRLLDDIAIVWTKKDLARERSWRNGLAAAQAFAADHNGSLHGVPKSFTHSGVELTAWLTQQRRHHRDGTLPARFHDALAAIDPTWHDSDAIWEQHYQDANRYFQQHGDLRPEPEHPPVEGRDLFAWLKTQRRLKSGGFLGSDRQTRLEAIAMAWSILDDDWNHGLAIARAYAAQHRDLDVPGSHVEQDFPLGSWLSGRRSRSDRLPPGHREALESLDPDWASARSQRERWDARYKAAAAYAKQHGHLPTKPGAQHPAPQGDDFRTWLREQRQLARRGTLTPARRAALDQLDPNWASGQSRQSLWDLNFEAALAYVKQHGRLPFGRKDPVPQGHDFRPWLSQRRQLARANKLAARRRAALDDLDAGWLADSSGSSPPPSTCSQPV